MRKRRRIGNWRAGASGTPASRGPASRAIWVPDTRRPGFAEEWRRQSRLLRGDQLITALQPPKIRARRSSCPICGVLSSNTCAITRIRSTTMAQLATADFKGAGKVAREQLVPGSGGGFGRYLPVEFREMGLGMHRAAGDFAEVVRARHYRRLDLVLRSERLAMTIAVIGGGISGLATAFYIEQLRRDSRIVLFEESDDVVERCAPRTSDGFLVRKWRQRVFHQQARHPRTCQRLWSREPAVAEQRCRSYDLAGDRGAHRSACPRSSASRSPCSRAPPGTRG